MSTSNNHIPQKAKYSQQIFCLRRQNRQDCQLISGPWAGWFGKE